MLTRKVIVAAVTIIVVLVGIGVGIFLLRERQELRDEAAVEGGQATVSISPATGSYKVGDSIQTSIYFNTANIAISGVAVRLTYPYSGTTPEISVTDISISSMLLSSFATGDWTCPTQDVDLQSGKVNIDISCANFSASGFTSSTDTLLANVTLKVERVPATNPTVIMFDPVDSIITRQSNQEDILLIPTSTGNYTIGGEAQPTNTPTPTTRLTLTPTPTTRLTLTPTPTGVVTKGGEELPDAGIPLPTIMGVSLGTLVVIASLILAL
jgi:hypothetical protein